MTQTSGTSAPASPLRHAREAGGRRFWETVHWAKGVPRRLRVAYTGRARYIDRRGPKITTTGEAGNTQVDGYWSAYTVNSTPHASAKASREYLEWRFDEYPLFREMAHLWGDHDGEILLDYGCGPGNDVTGFLIHTDARKVIGIDISRQALELTRRRLALHKIDRDRVELIHSPDADPAIPLPDDAVDYFQSMGVIHVTTNPGAVLSELHRVLRPGGMGRVMVYNQHSVWFHLYTAYVKMILEGKWAGLTVEQAFQKNTDGEDCPIARSYTPEEFGGLCEDAGFDTTYVGGHLSLWEMEMLDKYLEQALGDERLAERHRDFLRELSYDESGYPMWNGKHAGVGAIYELRT